VKKIFGGCLLITILFITLIVAIPVMVETKVLSKNWLPASSLLMLLFPCVGLAYLISAIVNKNNTTFKYSKNIHSHINKKNNLSSETSEDEAVIDSSNEAALSKLTKTKR